MRKFIPFKYLVCCLFLTLSGAAAQADVHSASAFDPAHSSSSLQISGWIPLARYQDGLASFSAHVEDFSMIDPVWYLLSAEGEIERADDPSVSPSDTIVNDPALRSLASDHGVRVVPVIKTLDDGGAPVQSMLDGDWHEHADKLVELVMASRYDGLEIDYESIAKRYKDVFSDFIAYLATQLHDKAGKILVVTLPAQTSDTDAYDYRAIAASADFVKIMAYDNNWQSPIPTAPEHHAPLNWIRSVVAYALEQGRIPAQKLILGLPTYGYTWRYDSDESQWYQDGSLNYPDAIARQTAENAISHRTSRATGAIPYFRYQANSIQYLQFYEDAISTSVKLDFAQTDKLYGVSFWYIGGEDSQLWAKLP